MEGRDWKTLGKKQRTLSGGWEVPTVINKNRFYSFEHKAFWAEWQTHLTDIEAKRFTRKIAQHFKHKPITLKFHGKRKSGVADLGKDRIRIRHNPSVLLLAHEIAHILTDSGHTKRALIMLDKIITYARRKNYWRKKKEK